MGIMRLIAGVDSSTQSCKVVICRRFDRARGAHRARAAPARFRGGSGGVVAGSPGRPRRRRRHRGCPGDQHRGTAARAHRARRRGARHPPRAALARSALERGGGRPRRRDRRRASRAPNRPGTGCVLHDHEAALARRPRTGRGGTDRGDRAAARLAHVAPEGIWAGRAFAARPRARRARDGSVRRERHSVLRRRPKRIRPGSARHRPAPRCGRYRPAAGAGAGCHR